LDSEGLNLKARGLVKDQRNTSSYKCIQLRQTAIFYKTEPGYGRRVAQGLGLDMKEAERLAGMSQEDRAKATAR